MGHERVVMVQKVISAKCPGLELDGIIAPARLLPTWVILQKLLTLQKLNSLYMNLKS